MGCTGTAVAVGHPDGNCTAGNRVAHCVGISQAFDHMFDRINRRVAVKLHSQLGTVGAVADDGADGNAAITDGIANDADLPCVGTNTADAELILVIQTLHAELILSTVVGDVVHFEQATVKIGGVGVKQANARVDQLWHSVDGVLTEGNTGRHIHQLWVGLTGDQCRVSEELLVDLVGVAVRIVVITPSNDEGTIGQPLDSRERAGAVVVVGINVGFVVEADAIGAELLH